MTTKDARVTTEYDGRMTNEWRPVLAALANEDARRLYAELILGIPGASGLAQKRRDRALLTLLNAGLIRSGGPDSFELVEDAAAGILTNSAEPKREGIHRFVTDGRIDHYPVRPAERLDVLEWVIENAIRAGEVLTEPQVNERLEPFHPDVATLRRYLVDEGLLLRTPSGSNYSRG